MLTLNTDTVRPLSEFNLNQNTSLSEAERLSDENNIFRLEPGRTVFMMLQVCNKAELCSRKQLGTVLIINDQSVLYTMTDSIHHLAFTVLPDGPAPSRRKKRDTDHVHDCEIDVKAPDANTYGKLMPPLLIKTTTLLT